MVPILRTAESEEALIAAARLAAERRATIAVVQRDRGSARPATCRREHAGGGAEREPRARRRAGAGRELRRARRHAPRARARSAGPAIVEEVERAERRARRHRGAAQGRARATGLRLDGRLRAQGEPGARDGRGEEGRRRESPRGGDPRLLDPAHRARPCHRRPTALLGGGIGLLLGAIVLVGRRPALCAIADGEEAPGAQPRPRATPAGVGRLRRDRARPSTSRSASSPSTRSASRRGSCSPPACVFILVALSYAEGTAAIPETGGAATLVRRAFNDPLGFMTGWALFLDYLIVIALAALFVPHYLGRRGRLERDHGRALGRRRRRRRDRGDRGRAARAPAEPLPARDRPRAASPSSRSSLLDRPSASSTLVSDALRAGRRPGHGADLARRSRSRSRWRCSPTPGSRPSPTSRPRRASRARTCRAASSAGSAPRRRLVRDRHRRASRRSRAEHGARHDVARTRRWWGSRPRSGRRRSPSVLGGRASRSSSGSPACSSWSWSVDDVHLRAPAGSRTRSASGTCCPHVFARLNRRTLIAPRRDPRASAAIAIALLIVTVSLGLRFASLASLYSFGVLLTFTAAQIAVIKLRFREPDLARPFRVPVNVRIRGVPVPARRAGRRAAHVGDLDRALATHSGARIAGPVWLAARRASSSCSCARSRGAAVTEQRRGAGGRPRRAARGGRVRAHPRADEARPDRRGGARDRDQAGGGAVGASSRRCT